MRDEDDVQFKVKGLVSATDIPSWTRRPPKWHELMELIRELAPGQTLVIEFPDAETANRARNVVRDELNAEIGRAAIRTRLVKRPVGTSEQEEADVYFTRLYPVDIIEEDSKFLP